MADELARVVHYKPAVLKMVFMVWSGIMPVLMTPLLICCFAILIGIPLLLGIRAVPMFDVEAMQLLAYVALGLLVITSLIGGLLFITALTGDDQIHISRDGIVFPLFTAPFLRFRRKRLWSEITRIYIRSYEQSTFLLEDGVVIEFVSGERISLDMSGFVDISIQGFQRGALEKFLLACDLLATEAEVAPEVAQLRDTLGSENRQIGTISYTEIWEQELSNRFHATVFVPLEPGASLKDGKLKVVRQLAFGGLAAVYLAQKDGRELVILKEAVVPADQDEALKAKAIEMFGREARFLAALDHPRIAKVIDHFVEGGRNYMLLERILGQSLRQLVNQSGPQLEPLVVKWSREIVEIVRYLHEQIPPIIHRDLTPENLILSEDGNIYLIDFGAANEFLGTVTGTVVGKHCFIAPEQFRGKASLSSDIYAFGGTAYFLLTGKNPLAMSVASPRAIDPNVSVSLDELVASCTCQEASGRPASAIVLLRMLDEIADRELSLR